MADQASGLAEMLLPNRPAQVGMVLEGQYGDHCTVIRILNRNEELFIGDAVERTSQSV